MIRGEWYRPFSSELISDRESCQAAIWKFNHNSNPAMGFSRSDRARMFREILRPPHTRGNTAAGDVPVDMGDGVCVDAPFNCEYGYNISIGSDVVIGTNCLIQDACKVRIGNKCILGPNVQLLANSWSTNPNERSGSAGVARGKSIIIEDNVLIGAGTRIMEGVRIGRNSSIGPGKTITQVSCSGSSSVESVANDLARILEKALCLIRCDYRPVCWIFHCSILASCIVSIWPLYDGFDGFDGVNDMALRWLGYHRLA